MEELVAGIDGYVESKKSDEKLLIEKFSKTGDEAYFRRLIEPHLGWLKRLAASIFNGNVSDMEDAVQEILISFYSDCRKFRDKSGFKTFFYSYARHKAIDYLRKITRHTKNREYHHDPDEAVYDDDPERQYLEAELRQEITESLKRLSPENRLLLTMKEYEGFSIAEIAVVTGIAPGTIKSRLHRARELCAKYLAGRIRE